MKHLLSYARMFAESAPSERMVTLYRGDSSKILRFTWRRFDFKWAFFGPGLYLTDDPEIADSYTIKGVAHDGTGNVIGSFSINSGMAKRDKTLLAKTTIAEVLVPYLAKSKVTFQHPVFNSGWGGRPASIELHEEDLARAGAMYATYCDYAGNVKKSVDSIVRSEMKDTFSWRTATKKEKDEMRDKLSAYYHSIFDYFAPHYREAHAAYEQEWRDKLRYIVQKTDDGVQTLAVVDKSREGGHVSSFEVPASYLAKCFDASTMKGTPGYTKIIDTFEQHYTAQYASIDPAEAHKLYIQPWKEVSSSANYAARGSFAVHDFMHYLIIQIAKFPVEQGKAFWSGVIKQMRRMGYTGWVYEGGRNLNTKPHKAYCVWNISMLHRVG